MCQKSLNLITQRTTAAYNSNLVLATTLVLAKNQAKNQG